MIPFRSQGFDCLEGGRSSVHHQPYFAFNHLDFQRFQAFTLARTLDAEPGQGFVNRVVRLAGEIFAIPAKEPAVVVIQFERQMAAAVFIGNQLPFETGKETISRLAIAGELEFQGAAFFQVGGPPDFYVTHRDTV